MFNVWLVRRIATGSPRDGWYAKMVTLPIPPFPGLGIILDEGQDPEDVECVFINVRGAVVAYVPDQNYLDDPSFFYDSPDEVESQLDHHVRGWQRLSSDCQAYDLLPA
jgi:hypothetical protein